MATAAIDSKAKAVEPESDIDRIKDDLKSLRDDLASLAATTGKVAAGQAKKQVKRAGALAEDAAESAATYRDMLVDKVKDHPLSAVGAALIAGFVISSLRRR